MLIPRIVRGIDRGKAIFFSFFFSSEVYISGKLRTCVYLLDGSISVLAVSMHKKNNAYASCQQENNGAWRLCKKQCVIIAETRLLDISTE